MTAPKDALGVEVRIGDTVRVISYGNGTIRQADVGSLTRVDGFTRKGYLKQPLQDVAHGRALDPTYVAVRRRDGAPGHEGNRPAGEV